MGVCGMCVVAVLLCMPVFISHLVFASGRTGSFFSSPKAGDICGFASGRTGCFFSPQGW